MTIAVGILVVAAPLLIRGGRAELWAARGWVIPLSAAIIGLIALLSFAMAAGALVLVTVGVAAASAAVAGLALLRPAQFAHGRSAWFRATMTGVLIVSIAVAVLGFTTARL